MREGTDAVAWLLGTSRDTEAVICVMDPSAFGALIECQGRRVSVPGDIAIAGFGTHEVAAICVPTLTTIAPIHARAALAQVR